MAKEVHKLTDTETMLAVLQSENTRLKELAARNAATHEQSLETSLRGGME